MRHRPILVEVVALIIDDHGMADTEVLLEELDVSAILASIIGRDDAAIVSFLADPNDFPEIHNAVQEHPLVSNGLAQIGSGFDWAGAIREGLHAMDDDEDIVLAWNAWMDAWDVHGGENWADLKWRRFAGELSSWLRSDERPSQQVLEDMAREIMEDPAFRSAIVNVARTPRTGGLDALRACSAIEASETARIAA